MQEVSYDGSGSAVLAGFLVGYFIVCFAFMAFFMICYWKIFEKAGKPGWAGFIPIYNTIILLEIVGRPWWYLFMFFIPIYGWFILPIIVTHEFSKSFGKDIGFTLGLLFLPFIFLPIMAFSKDIQYVGPAGRPGGPSLDNQIGSIGTSAA